MKLQTEGNKCSTSLTVFHDDVGQDQHSVGDNVDEDHMRMRGILCLVELGKCGNIAGDVSN
jgi:hypothetical protein